MKVTISIAILLLCVVATYANGIRKPKPTIITSINAPPARDRANIPLRNTGIRSSTAPTDGRQKRAATCGSQCTLTALQAQEAVNAHNLYRSKEAGSNILHMSWSDELASIAQAWADTCTWGHGMLEDCTGGWLGQNLFIAASPEEFLPVNMTAAAEQWAAERNNYDFATSTCMEGKPCGHWSQLAWAKSNKVGCAYKNCPVVDVGGTPLQNSVLVVCDYYPVGNMGSDPIFLSGAPCTNCDSEDSGKGFTCSSNNLCAECNPETDNACTRECNPQVDVGCACDEMDCMNGGQWSAETCSCTCSKAFYGKQCERSCSCNDLFPDDCAFWKADGYCLNPDHSEYMKKSCITTCQYHCHLPLSCS